MIAKNFQVASITIRNLDPGLKARLRVRAARHGRSMEDEVRDILRAALADPSGEPLDLAGAIRRRFARLGGVDLPAIEREPHREPPAFED